MICKLNDYYLVYPLDPDREMFVHLSEFKQHPRFRIFRGSFERIVQVKMRLNKLTVVIKQSLLNFKRVAW